MSRSSDSLFYFVPYSFGGSADYSRCQIQSLLDEGVSLTVLAPSSFTLPLHPNCRILPPLIERKPSGGRLFSRATKFICETLAAYRQLDRALTKSGARTVLLGDFSEYLSPLWAGPFLKHQTRGVRFSCILHDPVRNFQRGPEFWHRLSLSKALSFLDVVFVHGNGLTSIEKSPLPIPRKVVIPHGVYASEQAVPDRTSARYVLGLPDHAKVFLSFGYIRDDKNLDAFIRAMPSIPDAFLVVAGEVISGTQRGIAYYKELAGQSGVSARVVWHTQHIPSDDVPFLFAAADCVLLLYAKTFHSMSGVFSSAIYFGCPCLASDGGGPLTDGIRNYRLGVECPALDPEAIACAARTLIQSPPEADWEGYRHDHSWEENARRVAAALGLENTLLHHS